MTNKIARHLLEELNKRKLGGISFTRAVEEGIKALKQIDKIRDIISIHPNYVEEDVMKYKMIVEVLSNDK